ncbi:hypothetical protein WA1_21070 [Scytonema hofmannii PCC 7110]|uniref:Uncharacterized protein n=1 Tax=Scytonema hofmannii PCC 7110 TaxID=128403 RepID=A0A139XCN4_9CYAN|nr:hypothetical protein [Scytonema hofmannii]KYC42458.1 hypothetical protein WA1_21070 [Scytonema hofmannii PCC 7110]
MSNPATPPNPSPTPPNNPFDIIKKLFKDFLDVITNDRLANFLQILPYLIGIVIFLGPIALLIKNWYSATLNTQDLNEDFKTKVCENYKKLIQNRLDIEGNTNASIGKPSIIDNKDDSNINQLPFSCKYTILEGRTNLGSKEISIELNPLFPDLTNEINKEFEEKVDWQQVCKHETVIKQMEENAIKVGIYNKGKGDKILPGRPELLSTKKDVYPVFRWVCSYEIDKQGEDEGFQGRNTYKIDIKLESYCESKAKNEEIKRIKPTHHNYKDPYSLYCVNPHAKKK